ncbi:HTH 24 domain containing protein, partial [Asbolus verrucosus]
TGSVDRKVDSDRPKKRTDQVTENVRQIMEEAPRTSVRRLSQQVELSPATCRNILKKDIHLYPYRLQAVQQLREADYPNTTLNENLLNLSFFLVLFRRLCEFSKHAVVKFRRT